MQLVKRIEWIAVCCMSAILMCDVKFLINKEIKAVIFYFEIYSANNLYIWRTPCKIDFICLKYTFVAPSHFVPISRYMHVALIDKYTQ